MSKFEEFSQHYFRRKRTHGRTAEPKVLKARRVKATAVPSVFQCKVSVPADRLKKDELSRWVSKGATKTYDTPFIFINIGFFDDLIARLFIIKFHKFLSCIFCTAYSINFIISVPAKITMQMVG